MSVKELMVSRHLKSKTAGTTTNKARLIKFRAKKYYYLILE
jgi:hypothetical protein